MALDFFFMLSVGCPGHHVWILHWYRGSNGIVTNMDNFWALLKMLQFVLYNSRILACSCCIVILTLRLLHLDENPPTCLCFGINDSLFTRSRRCLTIRTLDFSPNSLGIFIFVLAIAYHYVMADPRHGGNWIGLFSLKDRATTCALFAEMRWRLEHALLTSPPIHDMALHGFLLVISSRTHRCFVLSWISSCTKRRQSWLLTDGDCNTLVRVMKLGSFTVPLLGFSWLWKIKAHIRTLNLSNQLIVHRQTRCPTGT